MSSEIDEDGSAVLAFVNGPIIDANETRWRELFIGRDFDATRSVSGLVGMASFAANRASAPPSVKPMAWCDSVSGPVVRAWVAVS